MADKPTGGGSGAAMKDLFFVIGVVIVLGIIWVITGGPSRSTESNFFRFQQPTNEGVTSSRFTNFFVPIQGGDRTSTNYTQTQQDLGRVRDYGETSPYSGLVTIEKTSNSAVSTDPQHEYVVLDVSSNLTRPLSITNWRLQSMISQKTATIGKATRVSTSGNVNIEDSISVSPQDRVYVVTGDSPTGYSFQVNKCSGYFEQFQDFTPELTKQCPSAQDELTFAQDDPYLFGKTCLDYINGIPRCTMPTEALPIGTPNSCALFITEKINYNMCVKNHRDDTDFSKPEWRVYLKQGSELWSDRDIIRLLDENGKTVDVFSY